MILCTLGGSIALHWVAELSVFSTRSPPNMIASGALIGQGIAAQFDHTILVQIHFEDLVDQAAILLQVVENHLEELSLRMKVQPCRSVDTDKSGVKAHVCILAR